MNNWGIFWIVLGVVTVTTYIAWLIVTTKAIERGIFDTEVKDEPLERFYQLT